MDNDDIISTLNRLIQTCKDGDEGFRVCAADISDPQLKTLFVSRAETCANAARELQEQVVALGGDPETSGTVSETLHRRWTDIKAALIGMDDEEILSECERGEDVAVNSYRNALRDDLPPALRSMVERQYKGAMHNHDQVKALRDQFRTAKNITRH